VPHDTLSKRKYDFYDYITVGFKVTDDTMEWYLSESGSPWKTEPYPTFTGGDVHSRAHEQGKAPDDCWQRQVPNPLNARIILNYALRDAAWAGGPPKEKQLPAEMLIDCIRVYQKR
jgi:hypothetical protein